MVLFIARAQVLDMHSFAKFPAIFDFSWGVVDVRDVALAHIKALQIPEAKGEHDLSTCVRVLICWQGYLSIPHTHRYHDSFVCTIPHMYRSLYLRQHHLVCEGGRADAEGKFPRGGW